MRSTALARIPVGVVVERRAAKSRWVDFLWRPVSVLVGVPSAEPWSRLDAADDIALFYVGSATVELHRTETSHYRDNLASTPKLWVALRPVTSGAPYELFAVTADPAEGEALTDTVGNLVEPVPMPLGIVKVVGEFVARHHVERPFQKRRRKPAESEGACRVGGEGERS